MQSSPSPLDLSAISHCRLPISWNSTFLHGKEEASALPNFNNLFIESRYDPNLDMIQMIPYITRNHLFRIPKSDIVPRITTMRITSVLSVFITNTPSE
jgi:hypothetical protein